MHEDININIHVHLHQDGASGREVVSLLHTIERKQDRLMAVAQDIKAAIADLDAETTAIGVNITNMAAKIKNTMTDAEVADVKAGFATLSARLKTLATDPTDPVPEPPPPLVELRRKG